LITGDRVRVTPRPGQPDQAVFEPSTTSRSALTSYSGGHTYVVPTVAKADFDSGRLDPALFDVTTLLAEQRDDANSKTMPVIVRYAGAPATAKAKQKELRGAKQSRVLSSIGARAAMVDKATAPDFWSAVAPGAKLDSSIQRVSLDRKVRVSLDQSVPQIGGPAAWQRGLTGKGVKVAILDTGLDPSHPDLAGRIGASENFTEAPDAVDHFGHGTHVASITAGSGAASGGKFKGVAPEATLLNGKVLDDGGGGSYSSIIAGMEWAVTQGASVVNLSLGSNDPSDGTDALSTALNRLSRASGTLFVVAAGNCYQPMPYSTPSPAAADEALAVGNLQRDGGLNESSCLGPRPGDGAMKPELSAPGTDIVAARAAGSVIGDPVEGSYLSLTGTSMATPHVAGTAALVAQAHPDWKAAQLSARLISTADPQQRNVDEEGAGRVDADQATDTSVTVDQGELELGKLLWPYTADDQVSRELTYSNPTGTAVTLQLAVSLQPAAVTPKLSATQLVVPANGQAKVTVTTKWGASGPGNYSGRVTATPAGADPLVTTIGWLAEDERYPVTVKVIGRDGEPAEAFINLAHLDGDVHGLGPELLTKNGTVTVRVPPGRYVASTAILSPATDARREQLDLLVGDQVKLPGTVPLVLDARKARPMEIVAEGRPDLVSPDRTMSYLVKNTAGKITGGYLLDTADPGQGTSATPSAKVSTGSSEFVLGARQLVAPYRAKVQGGTALTVNEFWNGPRFTGTKSLAVADAGSASTPDELKGVAGKLALIKRADADTRENDVLVDAAEEAGAAAALVYNSDQPGVKAVWGVWTAKNPVDVNIPAMRTTRIAAELLLDRLKAGAVIVQVTGQEETPYVYDLTQPWSGQVPAVATVRVKQNQLARIDDSYGAQADGTTVYVPRSGTTAGGTDFVGRSVVLKAPARLTSYVQANQTLWSSVTAYGLGDSHEFASFAAGTKYRPGQRVSQRWLAPVQNSGLPTSDQDPYLRGVRRSADGLVFELSPFQHQQEHAEAYSSSDSRVVLERDGKPIAEASDLGVVFGIPGRAGTYRAVVDSKRESVLWKHSPRVQTKWTWQSNGSAGEVMPLVLADLDLPQADAAGNVQTGIPVTIDLGLRHQSRSATKAKFATAKLELSYDGGKVWSELKLTKKAEGSYTTSVNHPATQAADLPTLRLTATDADGNKLEQEVTSAYGLTK
jgi:subtilisin family serine protease